MLALGATPARAGQCQLDLLGELPVTMEGMRASVPVQVNGKPVDFWLDSGAFWSMMPMEKAKELGLQLDSLPFGFRTSGIGGEVAPMLGTADRFATLGHEFKKFQFLVGGSDIGNAMIGANVLGIRDTEFDFAHGSVKLFATHGCDHAKMAYWAGSNPYFIADLQDDPNPNFKSFSVKVMINGAAIDAQIESGAPTSVITRRAALRAGINLQAGNIVPIRGIGGIGRHLDAGWVVPVAKVEIGEEQILNTRINVMDGDMGDSSVAPDMLLGMDFLMAHHIYVARQQRHIYFTYSGGKPFITTAPAPMASPGTAAAPPVLPAGMHLVTAVDDPDAAPKTANQFARRGAARISQRDFPGAIADLSEAIRRSPATAAYYRDRAKAYAQTRQPKLASADLDKALALSPDDPELLRMEGFRLLAAGDKAGVMAEADAAARLTATGSLDSQWIAVLYEQLGAAQKAIPLYDAMISLHRDDSKLAHLLNGSCWTRGMANVELAKAMSDCNRAIKLAGSMPALLDSRALIRLRGGDFAGAIADYDAALKANPAMHATLYARGIAKIAAGQVDAGKADEAAALAADAHAGDTAKRYKFTP